MTPMSADISTPCVNICIVDPVSALCVGCGRTVAEITAWRYMSEAERVAVMAGLDERLRDARSRSERGGLRRRRGRDR
jgi:uncharacterized protein